MSRAGQPLRAEAQPHEGTAARVPQSTAIELVDERMRLRLPDGGRQGGDRLTHQLFRYPAKFHPPVVQALLERYTTPGEVVYDPFAGSGTLLVEGALRGCPAIGVDIDPVAVLVARAKTRAYVPDRVEAAIERLLAALAPHDRGADVYEGLKHQDISQVELERLVAAEELFVPAIPRRDHWFRRYVVVDLARIHREIRMLRTDADTRLLLWLLFASIIRNASNADPVPVSGLEVTSHMLRRDEEGRVVDPFALIRRALKRGLTGASAWARELGDGPMPRMLQGDATRRMRGVPASVGAVITSPPYHNAVDYYRRHQLEMYWLALTASHEERLDLLPHYIGRPRIPRRHPLLAGGGELTALAREWEREIAGVSEQRARDFRHYLLSMRAVMHRLAERTRTGAPVVFVIGQSAWNGGQIPTVALFHELATPQFEVAETLWYPVVNRYMSYTRHNGANIDREHVVALTRTDARPGATTGS